MSAVIFFIAAIAAIAGAVGVVTLRNPFYSVLALVFHLISLAALFLLLRAEFVAAAQVVVYAGAVMVLYVFVVAYVGGGEQLTSGAVLEISARHPTADGRTFADLRTGDKLGGVPIADATIVPYRHRFTHDILPASDSAPVRRHGLGCGVRTGRVVLGASRSARLI